MTKWTLGLVACLFSATAFAQETQTAQQMQETARNFQRQGDYENAILLLNKAAKQEPQNFEVKKDLALTYYLVRQYDKAAEAVGPLLERSDADEQVFQIAALVQRSKLNLKEADRLYKMGLKKFPNSGMLYSEHGDLLETKEPGMGLGIKQWEKGIEMDAEYPKNYYYACRYYANNGSPLWAILYGETFANLESFTLRTSEIKGLLLASYKKLYAYGVAAIKGKNNFENLLVETFQKENSVASNGIDAETLMALRSRFILDWYATEKPPLRLFEFQRQLLREGLFEAYNQWLFGAAANMPAYQNWTASHQTDYNRFKQYQSNHLFKVPGGQYYNK